MSKGINRAKTIKKGHNRSYELGKKSKPCMFLSHKTLDKNMVREIGKYINNAGIDTYLDEKDIDLQKATNVSDDKVITNCIQEGLRNSTHVLCLLSDKTISSWWVPYEIGFGEKGDKEIAPIRLKELTYQVPSYLRIREFIDNIDELNKYFIKILYVYGMRPERFDEFIGNIYEYHNGPRIIARSENHPLAKYLY